MLPDYLELKTSGIRATWLGTTAAAAIIVMAAAVVWVLLVAGLVARYPLDRPRLGRYRLRLRVRP